MFDVNVSKRCQDFVCSFFLTSKQTAQIGTRFLGNGSCVFIYINNFSVFLFLLFPFHKVLSLARRKEYLTARLPTSMIKNENET